MKGDFTRFSHQPQEHYAGVLMQQGRVTLDADWNEQFDIDDHRWRVQTIDTIGQACAPEGNPGFGLSFTPDRRDLIIHPGRIYIDGILVELLPGTSVRVTDIADTVVTVTDLSPDGDDFERGQWVEIVSDETEEGAEPTIAMIASVDAEAMTVTLVDDASSHGDETGVRMRRIVTYLTQPFYPAAAAEPFADSFHPEDWGGQTHLVYLDLWRRHVTASEDPDIREVALGGPDTATRVQTVWALRIMRDPQRQGEPADASQIACHDQHPLWDALIAPSAGRMSAQAEAAPQEDDPCAVQPGAGYRGLENRLYRVEIHDPGEVGTATFKWSRHNGSILSSILDFPAVDEVEVHSLGKDKILRFEADNRVEAFSEVSELSGLAGTMASIVGAPDEAERTISLDTNVSVYDGHPLPRLRRWDHGAAEAVTDSDWIDLELGVQVRFGAGPFHVGDYWVIPARVATGDVEGFIEAPPRGIRHHFARVALVTWTDAPDAVLDCRRTFPPLCGLGAGEGDHCCTVTVGTDGDFETLHAAVDAVSEVAGPARICILPGEHRFTGPVVIHRSELTISGCGRTSRLVSTENGALLFQECRDIRLEDLWILSTSDDPTVRVQSVAWFEMVDCRIVNLGRRVEIDVEEPEPHRGGPHLGRFMSDTLSPDAAPGWETFGRRILAPQLEPGPGLRVDDGRLIVVRGTTLVATPAATTQAVGLWFEHNLAVGGGVHVREGSEYASIHANTIERGLGPGVLLGGLVDGEEPLGGRAGVQNVIVRSNRIGGMGREGISTSLTTPSDIAEVLIVDNEIRQCGVTVLGGEVALGGGMFLMDVTGLTIRGNYVAENGPPKETKASVAVGVGIGVFMSTGVEIRNNTVAYNGPAGLGRELVLNAGIVGLGMLGFVPGTGSLLLGPPAAVVAGNTVITPEGPSVVLAGVGPMMVNDNEVVSTFLASSLLDVGRAVLVVNLGAASDTGLANFGRAAFAWPIRHGRVQVNDNQVTVQAVPGLPPLDQGADPFQMEGGDLAVGSSVAVWTLDDLSMAGNQILSEVSLVAQRIQRPIRASVWVKAATARLTDNRVSELMRTALLSYFGYALGHIATENVTTHCIRAEGIDVVEKDNVHLRCPRVETKVADYVVWRG
jgi:hypothetical protein